MKKKKLEKLRHQKEIKHYVDPNDLKEKNNRPSYLKEIAGLATILGAGVTGGAVLANDRVYAAESSVDRKSEIVGSNSITGSIDEEISTNNQNTASTVDSDSIKISQSESTEKSVTYSKSRSVLTSMSLSTSTSFSQSASASAVSLSESASASASASKSSSEATSKGSTEESKSQKSESKSTAENTKTNSESESILTASSVSKNDEGSGSTTNSLAASSESISTLDQRSLNITNLTVNPQSPVDLSQLFGMQLVQLNGTVSTNERKLAQIATATTTVTNENSTSSTPLQVGEGEGVLVDTTSTANPPMSNPNGAQVTDQTLPSPYQPTSQTGWHTVTYYSTLDYDDTQVQRGGKAINGYMRYSYNSDPSNYTVTMLQYF